MSERRPVMNLSPMDGVPVRLSAADRIGCLSVAQHWDGVADFTPGWLTVEHADPRILIGEGMMDRIAKGECHPAVKMYTVRQPGGEFEGGKLEIHARNRKLIYRIVRFDTAMDGYICEWPD